MAQGRRVVVTGLGTVCSNGNEVSSAWKSVVNGKSGAELIDKFDTSEFSTKFGATVKDFENNPNIDAKESRRMDLFIQFGLAACAEAITDSGINFEDHDVDRIGVSIGSGIGDLNRRLLKGLSFFVPGSIITWLGTVAIKYGLGTKFINGISMFFRRAQYRIRASIAMEKPILWSLEELKRQ